jgi:hypothetical protein
LVCDVLKIPSWKRSNSTNSTTSAAASRRRSKPRSKPSAVKYAEHELHASPAFLGDVNNAVRGPTFSKKGVLVSTGDEADVQFFTGRVTIDRSGKPTGLKTL